MKHKLIVAWLFCVGALVAASPLGAQAPQPAPQAAPIAAPASVAKPILPEPISTYAAAVDDLFYVISGITFVVLVLVFALFGIFAVKYRYQDGRKVVYTHGNNLLEVVWTAATAGILIFIIFAQKSTWEEIKVKDLSTLESRNPFKVRIFGEQFAWHFVYPGQDGVFEPNETKRIFPGVNPVGLVKAENDVYSGSLMVPAGVPVIAELFSLPKFNPDNGKETPGVLHSFYQPNLRFKQDLVPYHPAKIWFEVQPGKTGKYEIVCAELCGLGHYQMRADFKVLSDAELATALNYDWKAVRAKFADEVK